MGIPQARTLEWVDMPSSRDCVVIGPKHCMRHTLKKKKIVGYLKFKFNWVSNILLDNPIHSN